MRFEYKETNTEDFFIIDNEGKLPALFVIYSTEEIVEEWVKTLNGGKNNE